MCGVWSSGGVPRGVLAMAFLRRTNGIQERVEFNTVLGIEYYMNEVLNSAAIPNPNIWRNLGGEGNGGKSQCMHKGIGKQHWLRAIAARML